MDKIRYNQDKDPSGAIGLSLADNVILKYDSIENAPKLINKKTSPLEKTIEILKTTPVDLVNFGTGYVFERILNKIAKTGYIIENAEGVQIENFSRLDGPQKREIYLSLKRKLITNNE